MIKVVFVCLGNICRSPAAEGILINMIEKENLQDKIQVDSAGVLDYHEGENADRRMISAAKKRGYDLITLARQFKQKDFENFDYIITLDNSIHNSIVELDINNKYKHKIYRLTWFCKEHDIEEVPDPYYGTAKGFDYVLDILEDACRHLLITLKKDLAKRDFTKE